MRRNRRNLWSGRSANKRKYDKQRDEEGQEEKEEKEHNGERDGDMKVTEGEKQEEQG